MMTAVPWRDDCACHPFVPLYLPRAVPRANGTSRVVCERQCSRVTVLALACGGRQCDPGASLSKPFININADTTRTPCVPLCLPYVVSGSHTRTHTYTHVSQELQGLDSIAVSSDPAAASTPGAQSLFGDSVTVLCQTIKQSVIAALGRALGPDLSGYVLVGRPY
jgi:hypothetical protein